MIATKRIALRLGRVRLLLALLALGWPAVAAATSPPNIIMIVVDDMAWASTSIQMDPDIPESASDFHQTPHLEDLASRGVVFSNGYAAGPICSPSRAALMTGISPARLNVTDLRQAASTTHSQFTTYYTGRPLTPPQPLGSLPDEKTITEHVRDLGTGYRSGFFGKFDWWPHPREDYGLDDYSIRWGDHVTAEDPAGIFNITSKAIDFIEQEVTAGNSFFTTITHESVKSGSALPETIAKYEALEPGERHYDPGYAALHEDLDTSIGQVLETIDELGVADNTYILFTADHGAPIGVAGRDTANEPLFSGKGTLWEGGIRVPYIVAGPNIPSGQTSDVPVTGVDIFSTIYDIAGGTGPADARTDGTSLLPLLENGGVLPEGLNTLSRNEAPNGELYFHYPHYAGTLPTGRTSPASAIRDGDYKLVRVYGEDGNPDEYLLFDIAANPTESADPNSSLNLASQFPEVVSTLSAKLENWFQAVDASLPYDVRDDIELNWRGDTASGVSEGWRSVEDVDYLERERWEWRNGTPSVELSNAHQPGVANQSLHFDGSVVGYRRFLHVSDARDLNIDSDHSATLEFWLKLDDLATEQVVFEAGSESQGFSLSLGDADASGTHNDLRFRMLTSTGESLALTTPIDRFADPTNDFVQLVLVINDDPANRFAELFINGVSRGRATGTGVLDWDNYDDATIGCDISSLTTLGASAATTDPVFSGGALRGHVASFAFRNTATSSSALLDAYHSTLTTPAFEIASTNGDAETPSSRPASVASDEFTQDGILRIIHERVDTLNTPVTIHTANESGILVDGLTVNPTDTLSAGVRFSSYLLHFDSASNSVGNEQLAGSISFDAPIIGLITDEAILDATDIAMGVAGEFDLGDRSIVAAGTGLFTFSSDFKTLFFDLTLDNSLLTQFRVLVAAESLLAGDYDGNGFVEFADYVLWRSEFGQAGASAADGNRDGIVDAADYTVWRDNLGAVLAQSSAATSTATPEPAGAGLLLFALLVFAGPRTKLHSTPARATR